MTPQETREAFMTEFQEMLRRYNAVFEVYSDNDGFDNCTPFADINFNGIYDEDGNTIREPSEFQMPSYIS
jgi:hypothetical protein